MLAWWYSRDHPACRVASYINWPGQGDQGGWGIVSWFVGNRLRCPTGQHSKSRSSQARSLTWVDIKMKSVLVCLNFQTLTDFDRFWQKLSQESVWADNCEFWKSTVAGEIWQMLMLGRKKWVNARKMEGWVVRSAGCCGAWSVERGLWSMECGAWRENLERGQKLKCFFHTWVMAYAGYEITLTRK